MNFPSMIVCHFPGACCGHEVGLVPIGSLPRIRQINRQSGNGLRRHGGRAVRRSPSLLALCAAALRAKASTEQGRGNG